MKTNTKIFVCLGVIVATLCSISSCGGAYAQAYYPITVTSSSPQDISIQGDRENAIISSDEITVSTECRYGYNFIISTSVNNNNLYLDGDITNNADGTFFTSSDGSTPLSNATNTWGYYYSETDTPTTASIFSAVPTLGSSAVIRSPLENPSESTINDNFSIYYGVSVSSSMKSGTYKMIPDANNGGNDGVIVYQATIADACMRYTVNFDPTDTYTGSAVTGTGTMTSQSIYEGVATTLNSNTFTAPTGYEFVGWNTAQDGSGTTYANGASVTDLALAGESVTLYAMWSDCPSSICYRADSDEVEGTMGRQPINDGETATLFPSNYSRDGYGFAGWSNVADYATNPDAEFYGPMEDITIPAGTALRGLNLHAVWIESAGDLQDATKVAELCGSGGTDGSLTAAVYNDEGDADESTWSITAGLSSVSALTDTRDGQTYAIARLSDGNCWMIENLRLADTHKEEANTVSTTLTVANTNNPLNDNDPTNPTVVLKHNFADTQTFTNLSHTSNLEYNANTAPDGWCTTDSADCNNQSRLRTHNTTNRTSYTPTQTMSKSANLYSYGNYYNWYSATAGNGTYDKTSGDTVGDICPAGWHLPTGTGSGEFGLLSNSLGGYKNTSNVAQSMSSSTSPTASTILERIRQFPNNFLLSGDVDGSLTVNRGSGGLYWSSTSTNNANAYAMILYQSNVYPGVGNYHKFAGRTVRCLATR